MSARYLIAAFCCAGFANAGNAEMRPLQDLMDEGAEPSYAAIRCAVLYVAPIAHAGTDRFEENVVLEATNTFDALISAAVSFRAEEYGGIVEQINDAVLSEAEAVMALYLERFADNYSRSGQAFGADELYASDVDFCGSIFGSP